MAETNGGDEAARQARADALGYFWMPCPVCGAHFSGEEWVHERAPGDHYASIPTEVRECDDHGWWVRAAQGICPTCTYAGVGCQAHAAYRIYHPGCEAVPPPEGAAPYVMRAGIVPGKPIRPR